jgi:hypothetical protein
LFRVIIIGNQFDRGKYYQERKLVRYNMNINKMSCEMDADVEKGRWKIHL